MALIKRVAAEFDELAGASIRLGDAWRLLQLRPDVCRRLLEDLVDTGVLRRNADGSYARAR